MGSFSMGNTSATPCWANGGFIRANHDRAPITLSGLVETCIARLHPHDMTPKTRDLEARARDLEAKTRYARVYEALYISGHSLFRRGWGSLAGYKVRSESPLKIVFEGLCVVPVFVA